MWGSVPFGPPRDGDCFQGRWYCPHCGQVIALFYGMTHFPDHVHWGDDGFEWCPSPTKKIQDYLLERAP